MPRANLAHTINDVPVTVAAAAQIVGVSPSTLRTWDRRYRLSPSARTVGAHRRYTALDIARLKRMVELISAGCSACDAAHRVIVEPIENLGVNYDVATLHPDDLRSAALQGDHLTTRSIIDKAIAQLGLLRTWTELINPALCAVRDSMEPKMPGFCPMVLLKDCCLGAIDRLVKEAPLPGRCSEDRPCVVVVGDHSRVVEVNVIGAALAWQKASVSVLCTGADLVLRACEDFVVNACPTFIVLVDVDCPETYVRRLVRPGVTVFLSGSATPDMHGEGIVRLRSAAATVDEIMSLL